MIAGPNGAGKTTFARRFLPLYADCKQFVNADLIAGGLSPFSPETAALRAGRLLLEQIHLLSRKGEDFGFETTLSGIAHVSLLRRLKAQGYTIHLFFLWIPSVELALKRIADRVRSGGHDIPEKVVRRRFERGIRNLFKVYKPLLDSWLIFDNSGDVPQLVSVEERGKLQILIPELFSKITRGKDR